MRTNRARNEVRWTLVELGVSLVLGLVLLFPLNRKDLAEIAWLLGLFFSFGHIAITRRLEEEFGKVQRAAEALDLSQRSEVEGVAQILRLYLAIGEPEFRVLKDDIVQDAVTRLGKLAHDKMAVAGGEYHVWLIDMLKATPKGEVVRAVSVMDEASWIDIPAEKKYLDANVAAAKRGVVVERIFLTARARLLEERNRAPIVAHFDNATDGMAAWVVFGDELELHDPSLKSEVGAGFVMFGSRVALIDDSIPPAEARGHITMNAVHLRTSRRIFDRLKLHAHAVDQKLLGTQAQSPPGNAVDASPSQ